MRFKNSVFEERYNHYWNNHVVVLDKMVKDIQYGIKFFSPGINITHLIEHYKQHTKNILSNIERELEAGMFIDDEYVRSYMRSILRQMDADFRAYSQIFPAYKDFCLENAQETFKASFN